jgi:hypothetical protein
VSASDTLEDAAELKQRMMSAHGWCYAACKVVGLQQMQGACEYANGWPDDLMLPVDDWARSQGFTVMSDRDAYVRRCETCKTTALYPWATELDPERMVEFINTDERCINPFPLDILKETLT